MCARSLWPIATGSTPKAFPRPTSTARRTSPTSEAELLRLFEDMLDHLRPSETVFEFLDIMRNTPLLPRPLTSLAEAAGAGGRRDRARSGEEPLGLGARDGLRPWERALVRAAGRAADSLLLPSTPAAQACLRLGLPPDHLLIQT